MILERPELQRVDGRFGDVHVTRARVAIGPVVADAEDHERFVRAEFAQGAAERVDVGAVVGADDERRLERERDDDAEACDRVVQLAVIGIDRQAVADEEEIARRRELRAGDHDAPVLGNMLAQPSHERSGVTLIGKPDVPALVEDGLGAEAADGVGKRCGEITFIANLK